MELGLSSYTFTWGVGVPGFMPANPLTAYELVERAQGYKLGLLQIADNIPLEKWTQNELQAFGSFAAGRKVKIEMGSRCLTHEHTIKCLNVAELLHSPILRMVIDGADFEPDPDSIIQIIKDLVPEFKSRHIKLAIENHDRLKAREFEKIVTSVGSEWVGICLDSVNSMGAGEGFELVSEILLPYTINLHIKDFNIQRVSHKMGFTIEGKPAGRGMLNIETLIEKLNKKGLCKSAILELWTPPAETTDQTISIEKNWADESVKYLRKLLNC